jgi:hypothetical protein
MNPIAFAFCKKFGQRKLVFPFSIERKQIKVSFQAKALRNLRRAFARKVKESTTPCRCRTESCSNIPPFCLFDDLIEESWHGHMENNTSHRSGSDIIDDDPQASLQILKGSDAQRLSDIKKTEQ